MSEMTRRERIMRCYNFEGPDRMPIEQAFYSGALIRYGQALIDLMNQYPNDFGGAKHADYAEAVRDLNPEYHYEDTDPWGVKWEGRYEGILGVPLVHPIEDLKALKSYAPPSGSVAEGEAFEATKANVAKGRENDITGWSGPWIGGLCLFERMQWLRGYENLMMDFAERRPELDIIADMIVDAYMNEIDYGGRLGVDVMGFADDWGTQERLMISPALWRDFYKPRYAKMFAACHAAGAKVSFHSDGMILSIIPDLIEIGMDIFRPQFSCMDIRDMAAITRGKCTTVMDLDRQYTLPFGTPEQVRALVKEVVEVFGLP